MKKKVLEYLVDRKTLYIKDWREFNRDVLKIVRQVKVLDDDDGSTVISLVSFRLFDLTGSVNPFVVTEVLYKDDFEEMLTNDDLRYAIAQMVFNLVCESKKTTAARDIVDKSGMF